jgi:hypothetical protein
MSSFEQVSQTMARYNEAQEKLRSQYKGSSSSSDEGEEDLHISVPQQVEVNPEVFKDVEPLLFRGFLHFNVEINGVSFVLKSLNHHEFERLGMSLDLDNFKGRQQFYTKFLAFGVLLVDGTNVLVERDRWIPEITKMFEGLEEGARRKMIRHMSEINRRANRAVMLTEAYCLEHVSRLRWAQFQGLDLTSSAVTGFLGTPGLGLNWAQLTWRALNFFESQREQIERDWENAKFIASATAGSKGMSQVNSQDKLRRERELAEKLEHRDKVLHAAFLGQSLEEAKKDSSIMVARTVEELANQLEKDLKGEKDWHDRVVEEHEQKARDAYQQRRQQLQEMQSRQTQQLGPNAVSGGVTSFKGMSAAEVRERIQKQQQHTAERLEEVQKAYPEAFDPKMARFLDKWNGSDCPACPKEPMPERPRMLPFKRTP